MRCLLPRLNSVVINPTSTPVDSILLSIRLKLNKNCTHNDHPEIPKLFPMPMIPTAHLSKLQPTNTSIPRIPQIHLIPQPASPFLFSAYRGFRAPGHKIFSSRLFLSRFFILSDASSL